MDEKKRARLEAQGWKVGSTEEFLGLTPEEAIYVELRLRLSDAVRELRAPNKTGPKGRESPAQG